MAKYSAEELSTRINSLEIDEDEKIALMEDITDSISTQEADELESIRAEIVRKDEEIASLKEKYKARFMSAIEDKVEDEVEENEYKEEEVIDIKEI